MTDLPTGIVTFLFTDIQGSTQLLQELGDEYRAVQAQHQQILRDAIRAGGGAEIRTEGDSFFAVFPAPLKAVEAAVSAQRGLNEASWPNNRPLRVRMGLHTGEGRLSAGDYLGIDVNRAARIAASGHGGQVVISDVTRGLAERGLPEGVSIRDLGRHRLKDLEHPERLYDLVIDGLPSEFPELKSLDARPNNLPVSLSSFIGREDDRAAVVTLVGEHRLVTLTGPGGAGKTRLSIRAAGDLLDDFPDGVFFVDLSPITDPSLVPSAIAQVLGVGEQAERSPLEGVQQHVRDLRVLLVLDNFEQVVASAQMVQDLIDAAAKVSVLVTSRIPLHLYGEQEYAVPPLGIPELGDLPGAAKLSQYESVALFIDRARAARQDFEVTNENAPAVAEICVRLDGLPLAIELAASRVKVLSPEEILARLGHRLPLLTGGAANLPKRQRALKNTIAWSFDLLEDPERRLFARLAAFAGGFTLTAVDAIANPDGELGLDTMDGVASLADKSLLRRMESPAEESRFGMLETIREFATERLAETEDALIRRRHAEYFRDLATEAEPHFMGADDVKWLDRFEREHDNVRAALRWAVANSDAQLGLLLGAPVWRFWFQRNHIREGYEWMSQLLALPTASDDPGALAHGHTAAGGLAYWLSDFDSTERHYAAALSLYRELDDPNHLPEALSNMAYLPMLRGDSDAAMPLFEEALQRAREVGDLTRVAETSGALGFALMMKGDPEAALPLLDEAVAVAREAGNRFLTADGLGALALAHFLRGDRGQARAFSLEALIMFRDLDNVVGVGMMMETLGGWEGAGGSHERAARLWGAALAVRETTGGGAPMVSQLMGDPIPPARAALGDQAVDKLLEEGKAMSVDQAVAYALEEG